MPGTCARGIGAVGELAEGNIKVDRGRDDQHEFASVHRQIPDAGGISAAADARISALTTALVEFCQLLTRGRSGGFRRILRSAPRATYRAGDAPNFCRHLIS